MPPRPGDGRALAGLLLATALALLVHLAGLGHHLPCSLEDDALQAEQASWLRDRLHGTSAGPAALLPQYPLLLPALAALVPELAADPATLPAPTASDHLAKASEGVLRVRLVVALVSVLAVPATWALARRFLPPGWALFAAALLATALLPTCLSQQARPHAGFLGLSALAMVALLRLVRTGSTSAHVVAGLATGLAVATLHFGFFLLPALCAAHALAPERRLLRLLAALGLVVASAWIAYPTLDGGFDLPWSARAEGAGIGLHPSIAGSFHGRSVPALAAELLSWDPVLLVLAGAGLVLGAASAARRRAAPGAGRELLVLLCFALPFALAIGAFDRSPARFLLPLYPYLALLAAGAARSLAELVRRALPADGGVLPALAVAAVALALPVVALRSWVRLHTIPDTAGLAARWIEEHADRERETLATSPFLSLPLVALPVSPHPVPEWGRSPWERYLHGPRGATDARVPRWRVVPLWAGPGRVRVRKALLDAEGLRVALERLRPEWVAVERRPAGSPEPTRDAVLAAGGELRAVFDRGDPDAPALPAFAFGRAALRHVLRADRLGPTIEVWRMPD